MTKINKKEKAHITTSSYDLDAIKGAIPALSKKYSEKQIREIAIESRIAKYKHSQP